jgi:AcrR family transcriptional regulator
MGLLDEHKAERRERILRAARQIVGERGYDGLTMRDLAAAARVSVPTLYNLFGSKDTILVAELQSMAGTIAAAVPTAGLSFFQRALTAFNAGMRMIEESQEFYRAVTQLIVTSRATDDMRKRIEDAFVAIMKSNLEGAKRAGQLAEWAEPELIALHIWGLQTAAFLAWGLGQFDFPTFRFAAYSGSCHLLVGAARGPFLVEVEAHLRELRERYLANALNKEEPHAASRDR